jgi:pimeloyl-ACP methyl ester carboxylesterase
MERKMTTLRTVDIPHLGGSQIGCRVAAEYDPARPTLVLVNSFTTSSELYRAQFADKELVSKVNLIALEPYGHGATRTKSEQFTYWDSAIANIQVLESLGIDSAFVLGTSQGGWIALRMAMLAPQKIKGVIPLGTSTDYESASSRELGCWDADAFCSPWISDLANEVGPDWELSDQYCNDLIDPAFGTTIDAETRAFWTQRLKQNYRGDDGRRRLRMCTINLRDRDSLRGRLDYITCPVLWLHGTEDVVYSAAHAKKEIGLFPNAPSAELKLVEGGHHFLSATNPAEVKEYSLPFILNNWNRASKV